MFELFPEKLLKLKTTVCGAQPLALPATPRVIAGSCPQLFVTEKRQNMKKEILIICFIVGSFNPKNKFNLRHANVK